MVLGLGRSLAFEDGGRHTVQRGLGTRVTTEVEHASEEKVGEMAAVS